MDLTTTARVKEMLEAGGKPYGSAMDTLISQFIATYSAQIEKYLGRHVQSTARTETYDSDVGQKQITLSGFPVDSVTSVKNTSVWTFGATTAIDATNYNVDSARGRIVFGGYYLSPGLMALEVVYTGGMAANTAAFIAAYPDVAQAADFQIAYAVTRQDTLGAQSVGGQSGSVGWSGPLDLLPEVKRLLESERRYL